MLYLTLDVADGLMGAPEVVQLCKGVLVKCTHNQYILDTLQRDLLNCTSTANL